MTQIFAHRGSSGTHPENTMAAFMEAERVGAEGIELDVQYTKDKRLAVIHDGTVNRTTNGHGNVSDLTLSDIQTLDAGSWFSSTFKQEKVLSLEEVLSWAQKNNMYINIEIKYAAPDHVDYEEKVVKAVKDYKLVNRVIISTFNHYALKKISEQNTELECGILYGSNLYEPWNYAKTVGAKALHPHAHKTDHDIIAIAAKNDFHVRVYTVNKEEELKKLMKAGCPGIITDYPERALAIRNRVQNQ